MRAGFPDKELELFGPHKTSGTLDFFTGEVVGVEGSSRSDYLASEDHDLIAQDVVRATGGLGYFGLVVYAKDEALRKPYVRAFLEYALENAVRLAEDAQLVPLTDGQMQRERAQLDQAVQSVSS